MSKDQENWYSDPHTPTLVFSKLWHTAGDHLKDFLWISETCFSRWLFLSCRIFTLSAFERRLFQKKYVNMCLTAMFCRWWENTFSAFEILFLVVNSRYMFFEVITMGCGVFTFITFKSFIRMTILFSSKCWMWTMTALEWFLFVMDSCFMFFDVSKISWCIDYILMVIHIECIWKASFSDKLWQYVSEGYVLQMMIVDNDCIGMISFYHEQLLQ